MKFIHTADWQIGMKASHVGEVGDRVRGERLEASKRVVDVASKNHADFILIAGDTFEHNGVDRVLVQKVADILAKFNGTIYIIPGNHDPYIPGSVWGHPSWGSHKNLRLLLEPEPLEIQDGFLFPCPIYEKRSSENPTSKIDTNGVKGIKIGIAHGTVEGIQSEEQDYPIPRDAAARTGLDYLALGHWHSTATYNDSKGVTRMAYSGTHEPTKFGERDSGNVLLVEIERPDSPPKIQKINTAGLLWETSEEQIKQSGDMKNVRERIENQPNPDKTLVRVILSGLLWFTL